RVIARQRIVFFQHRCFAARWDRCFRLQNRFAQEKRFRRVEIRKLSPLFFLDDAVRFKLRKGSQARKKLAPFYDIIPVVIEELWAFPKQVRQRNGKMAAPLFPITARRRSGHCRGDVDNAASTEEQIAKDLSLSLVFEFGLESRVRRVNPGSGKNWDIR